MGHFFCNINSAVMSKEQKSFLIPPICYKDRIYIISDKKLYYVLEQIEKIKDFLIFTRENGLKQTRKWLQKNNLINEGFLENVCRYSLSSNISKPYKYYFCLKDENYNPYLSEDLFKQYFKSAYLHNFLQSNNIAFNIYIEKQLESIFKELRSIYNLKDFKKRRLYIRNNFFQSVVFNFAQIIQENISNIDKILGQTEISYLEKVDYTYLKFFCISGIKDYEKTKFTHTNMRYKECLPENTTLSVNIKNSQYDIEELVESSSEFAKCKMEFDKKYINGLLENCSKKHPTLLQTKYVNKMFSYIQDSNILFDTSENIFRALVIINLNQENLEELNKLFYGEKNKVHSLVVQSANESEASIYSPYGYAKLCS